MPRGKAKKKPRTKRAAPEEPIHEQQTDVLNLEGLLDLEPSEMLEMISKLGPDAIAMIMAMYDEMMGEIRPVLKLAPELVGMVAKDASPLVAAVLTGVNELCEAEDMKVAMAASRGIKARNRKLAYDAYQAAGFSTSQSFALVLQDAASMQAAAASMKHFAATAVK